jgi:hypothetical protein
LRQRITALVAAYAIALASLAVGFGAAQAAVEALDGGYGVICHSDGTGSPPTGSQDSNGTICLKSCIGCISALTTVLPPTVALPAGPLLFSFKRLDPPAPVVTLASTKANANRSRGPPLAS